MPTPTVNRSIRYVNPFLLDIVKNPSIAYGLRKLSSKAALAIRVRRSTDNAETDIGFSGKSLDTATLLGFVGAGNGFIVKWYDQSGNDNHAVQNTAGYQPLIVSAGTYQSGILFNNSDMYLDAGTVFNNKLKSSTFVNLVLNNLSTNRILDKNTKLLYTTSVGKIGFGQNYSSGDGLWTTDNTLSISTKYGLFASYTGITTEKPRFFVNNVEYTGVTAISSPAGSLSDDSTYPLTIGNRPARDREFQGFIYDLILYDRVLEDSERTKILSISGKF